MTDYVTPGYHRRSAKGEVFFSPMHSVSDTISVGAGTGYLCHNPSVPTDTWEVNGNLFPFYVRSYGGSYSSAPSVGWTPSIALAIDPSDIADAVSEVSTSVLSERGRSKQNLFESMAELDRTLGMLSQSLLLGEKILKKVSLRGKVDAAANAYLLYRYGMKPLMQDISGIMDSLDVKTRVVRESTRARTTLSGVHSESRDTSVGVIRNAVNLAISDELIVKATSYDEYVIDKAFAAGISLKGLLTTPWELVPFSFVADWFVNLGDVIGAYAPTPGFTQLGSCVSLHRTTTNLYSAGITTSSDPNYVLDRGVSGSLSVTRVEKSRQAMSPPRLVIKSSFGFQNLTRCLDASALLNQRFASVFR